MVGDDETLYRRAYSQKNYTRQSPEHNYVAQETNPYPVEATMLAHGIPASNYLVQSPGYDATCLGQLARLVLIGMCSLRTLADTSAVSTPTEHRFQITLDLFQHHVLLTTGYLAPNARAYALFENKIRDYIRAHLPLGRYDKLMDRIEELPGISHLTTTCRDPGLPPDTELTTGHFGNLNFHEHREDPLHLCLKLL